jgi:hypothetical protein
VRGLDYQRGMRCVKIASQDPSQNVHEDVISLDIAVWFDAKAAQVYYTFDKIYYEGKKRS